MKTKVWLRQTAISVALVSLVGLAAGCTANSSISNDELANIKYQATSTNSVTYESQLPNFKKGLWQAPEFTFHDGSQLENLNLGYITFGNPEGEAVLILHGTNGSGSAMLAPSFANNLFGENQPLDAKKYFIIMPDALGTGSSAKPSDGLKNQFPKYNYDDMVQAQYRLVTEGLGIKHLRLVLGNSMGGMQTWLWGVNYPDFMDALMPLASLPQAMSGRNWMTRDLLVEMIKSDPSYNDGNYKEQPQTTKIASAFFNTATNGGTLHLYKLGPDGNTGSKYVQDILSKPFTKDTNDTIYQWSSSQDYDPSAKLSKIKAYLLAVNSADDERNPQIFGSLEKAVKEIKHAKFYIIPETPDTLGHGTTMQSKYWVKELSWLLKHAPHRNTDLK